ncbi:hypothetical protein GGX14DRAFT_582480 [Mycena pura]|uniref:Uncharacterized protein n=1 Tax=Mycena pura TaxID=153505 RepID=A0AAD7E5K9_9AGAR|nr:hypothetical protein GGX14DRAFT_582480 [Mycena pura]
MTLQAEAVATMPTYRRKLGPNELSYFLPSRAYGLNDMFVRIVFHGPPALVSPLRIRIAWAVMRLRHSTLACRVEMQPGDYDNAQFAYTPPSCPSQLLEEAAAFVHFHSDISGPALLDLILNGPRMLTSDSLSRIDVVRRGQVSPGIHEFHLALTAHHMIGDALAGQQCMQQMLEFLAGSVPGGAPRTDSQLLGLLNDEWTGRWGGHCPANLDGAIVPAIESRISGIRDSKFYKAVWKVDQQNLEKRVIGGQQLPRTKSTTKNTRFFRAKFSASQTNDLLAKCKSQGVSPQDAVFAICNSAWIRLCRVHPEFRAPDALPTLMYTAINIRRLLPLAPAGQLDFSLALGYHTVTLPSFGPRALAGERAMFWARARAVRQQIGAYTRSPLLPGRVAATGVERAARAKRWAHLDDGLRGPQPAALPPAPAPPPALIGVTQTGDVSRHVFREERYPALKLVDVTGGTRKGPGGLLLTTRVFQGQFMLWLVWDAAARPAGLVEAFWRNMVDGVHEYMLEDPSLRGTAEEEDCLTGMPLGVHGKL